MGFDDLDAIAVTEGPGLVGALLIGVNAAKALSFAHQIPLVGVHHIAGHIYANRLIGELQFPALALVVSGGHTELVYMKEHGSFEVIGETLDDAAGEAYDKVARTMGLPYPGGPQIVAVCCGNGFHSASACVAGRRVLQFQLQRPEVSRD